MKGFYRAMVVIVTFLFIAAGLNISGMAASTTLSTPKSEKNSLSIFLSNFAEARLENFSEKTLEDETMVNFAISYNYLNYRSRYKTTGTDWILPKTAVKNTIVKFFNKTPKEYGSGRYKLVGDSYIVPLADGESYPFAKVDKITRISKGLYEVKATTYGALDGFFTAKDIVKNLEQLKSEHGDAWMGAQSKITAKVRKVKNHYVLLTYVEKDIK